MSQQRRLNFIAQSIHIHGALYDYSQVDYINTHTPVTIVCSIHGNFNKRPVKHTSAKEGCPKCSEHNKLINACRFKSFQECVEHCSIVHNNRYEYLSITPKLGSSVITTDAKLTMSCNIHGIFESTLNKHIYQKTGCRKCSSFSHINPARVRKTTAKFITQSMQVHGTKYSYELTDYKLAHTKITITCPSHGPFRISPSNHIHHSQGCPMCYASGPEQIIRQILLDNNIYFEEQKKFNDCLAWQTNAKLRYDFFIPEINTLIEYDGIHHFQPIVYGGDTIGAQSKFVRQQHNDRIKTEYAATAGIKLIRIPYTEHRDIRSRITDILTNRQ